MTADPIPRLIEDYRAAWNAALADPAALDRVTSFFHLPCLVIGADGATRFFQALEDVRAFNAARLAEFRAGGVASVAVRGARGVSHGPATALAVVDWALLRADGSTERAWRHHYTVRLAPPPSILVSAFQTGS